MTKLSEEDDALLEELGIAVDAKKDGARTPREERIIAGFEEVQRFLEKHGRSPQHVEDRDIFERLYAVRLDRLRTLAECRTVLGPLDHQGLLSVTRSVTDAATDNLDDDALLAQLGFDAVTADITDLRHVRSAAEKREAEEIANRQRCENFDRFEPLFAQVRKASTPAFARLGPFRTWPRSRRASSLS